jgi:para-nitrobenzyl esterase
MKFFIRAVLALLLIFAALSAAGYAYFSEADKPAPTPREQTLRETLSGPIIGYVNDAGAYIWQGVPFAEPPVGELRWRAPRPTVPWNQPRATTAVGNECASQGRATSVDNNVVEGDEDCLYLNIFSPPEPQQPLPVMFWIHGGANTVGSGGYDLYDGSRYALEHNVVVVTVNYRLGPFGWFTHPALRSEDASGQDNSGNYGTLDQIHALKWVQGNISAFGGDPERVTIFGESAGGWNVLAMMASPLASKLFHGAIVQSGRLDIDPVTKGENFASDAIPGDRLSSREIISKLLILDGSSSTPAEAQSNQKNASAAQLSSYLREKSTADIFAAYRDEKGGKVNIIPDLFGDGVVLPQNVTAQTLFSDPASYNAVPVILGTNLDEAKLFLSFNTDQVNTVFGVPVGIKDLARYDMANRYSTDEWKINGVDSLASVMRAGQGENVYAYRFDANSFRDLGLVDLRDLLGAPHAIELPYVFGNFNKLLRLVQKPNGRDAQMDLSSSIMSYWAEFAYTGSPGTGRSGKLPDWTPWQNKGKSSNRLMVLDSDIGQGIRMSPERMTMKKLKRRFFSDQRFTVQSEYCDAYKKLFRRADFDSQEYQTLGTGCPVDKQAPNALADN